VQGKEARVYVRGVEKKMEEKERVSDGIDFFGGGR